MDPNPEWVDAPYDMTAAVLGHPEWAEQTHVDYTNGQTCNCHKCIDERGFFMSTLPRKDFMVPIFYKRETIS